MVPPPAVPGDEFDFDSMTPEEQLAWLESLARRQGVSEDELITAADMDVPIPENVVIDEPGYVPYSITGDPSAGPKRPTPADKRQEEPPAESEPVEKPSLAAQREPDAEEAWLTELLGEEAEAEPEQAAPVLDQTAEAMRWLDELAVKADSSSAPGTTSEEAGIFDWGVPDEETAWGLEEEPVAEAAGQGWEEPPTPGEEESSIESPVPDLEEDAMPHVSATDQDDFLGGVDPMRWLESLAVRQGARPEELLTPADVPIEEPPADAVIEEPGYVPFESTGYAFEMAEASPEPMVWQPEEETSTVEAMPAASEEQPIVAATVSPDESLPPEPAEEIALAHLRWRAALEERSFDDDPLSWLEKLATEPEMDAARFLAVEEGEGSEPVQEYATWSPALAEQSDPLAGLSDEEIERAFALGTLTPEQELAWLKRQAARLAESRESDAVPEEIQPAEPVAELPSWIADMRPPEGQPSEAEPAALFEREAGLVEEQLADWAAAVSAELDAEAPADEAEAQTAHDAEETGLRPAVPVEMPAWLLEETESPAQPLVGEEVPDWLRGLAEEETPQLDDRWLTTALPETSQAEADWLRSLDKAAVAAQGAETISADEAKPGVPQGVPADQGQIAAYQQRLAEAPEDHAVRLALARALLASGESTPGYTHYEKLIESAQLLPEVINDLVQLTQERPRDLHLHRLLGDAYRRHGRLKEAIQAYERALRQF